MPTLNPPTCTDRPFKTIKNADFQKCPLVLCTHGDTICTVLVASCTTIQIHSNGFRVSITLIHHLERIQTRFCISCTTIWKDPNKACYQHCSNGITMCVQNQWAFLKVEIVMVSNGLSVGGLIEITNLKWLVSGWSISCIRRNTNNIERIHVHVDRVFSP